MKIKEITRNSIARKYGDSAVVMKSPYKKTLPIKVGDYQVLYRFARNLKGKKQIRITVWDNRTYVAEMQLDPFEFFNIRVYEVIWVGVASAYSGQGISTQLYKGLVSKMGINLIQTVSHSEGAIKIWLRLAQDPAITAFGVDRSEGLVFNLEPHKNETELKSARRGIILYDNNTTGMVLIKRGSKECKYFEGLVQATMHKRSITGPDPFGNKKFDELI
jgi:hypothetical protein